MPLISKIALALAFVPTISGAADLSVFGFELGKPLTLPSCSAVHSTAYGTIPDETCVTEPMKTNGYPTPVRRVIFSRKDAPAIVKSWNLVVLESGGNLIGVRFGTFGMQTQDGVFQTLKEKYGAPSTLDKKNVRTETGASFDSIESQWKPPGLLVTFEGITTNIEQGEVLIDLPEATALRASFLAAESTDSGKKL